jgi:hypothetical protein
MNSKSLVAVGAGLIVLGSVAAASAKSNQESTLKKHLQTAQSLERGKSAQK